MQYLAAYTLSTLSGKEPTQESLTAILNATGKPVDAAQVKAVISSLKGKQVHELITKGQSKLGSGSAAPVGKGNDKKDDKKKDEKKAPQPKKEEKKQPEPEPEEENFDLDLFG